MPIPLSLTDTITSPFHRATLVATLPTIYAELDDLRATTLRKYVAKSRLRVVNGA